MPPCLLLNCSEQVEYKYVLVSERTGDVTWQPGANRVLELGEGGQVGGAWARAALASCPAAPCLCLQCKHSC